MMDFLARLTLFGEKRNGGKLMLAEHLPVPTCSNLKPLMSLTEYPGDQRREPSQCYAGSALPGSPNPSSRSKGTQ